MKVPVSIFQLKEPAYPDRPPFDPPELFPELPWRSMRLDPENRIYPAVRESFRLLGMIRRRSVDGLGYTSQRLSC